MAKGNHGQDIFRTERDYRRFQSILPVHLERHGTSLLAYCLMPNHLHLLVRVGEVPLGTFMQSLLLSHAKLWNTKYHQTGHLFQGPYKDIICRDNTYLKELSRYIHLNPVRKGLADKAWDWPWSSVGAYLGRSPRWIQTDLVLDQFHGNRKVAVERFKDFLHEGGGQYKFPFVVKDGCYVRKEEVKPVVDKRASSTDAPPEVSPDEFLKLVAQAEGIPVEDILGRCRYHRVNQVRLALSEAVKRWWGWNGSRTGQWLKRDRSTIAKMWRSRKSLPRGISLLLERWKTLLHKR